MTLLRSCTLLVPVLALLLPATTQAVDLRAQMLANPCLSCHGPDSKSAGSIPPIVNLKADYIKSTMLAFRADERKGTIMNRIAKGYTDEEIEVLAKYFSK